VNGGDGLIRALVLLVYEELLSGAHPRHGDVVLAAQQNGAFFDLLSIYR
jgi:hypothetical protein